jgi:hypothetical protein
VEPPLDEAGVVKQDEARGGRASPEPRLPPPPGVRVALQAELGERVSRVLESSEVRDSRDCQRQLERCLSAFQ